MQIREDFELMESLFIELSRWRMASQRCCSRFIDTGTGNVLLEMVPSTGNRLLRFSSKDRRLIYAVLAGELGGLLGGEGPQKNWSW